MAERETYHKGRELRRQLMGDACVERANQTVYAAPIMQTFVDVATETVFGALGTRPGLDRFASRMTTLITGRSAACDASSGRGRR